MKKSVLITIAAVVGLLALWLIVILVYPSKEETVQPTASVTPTGEQALAPSGGSSQATVATVEIVDDLSNVSNGENVEAQVTIE